MTAPDRWDIVVVGGANTDYMVRGSKLPGAGDAVTGEAFHTAPGGKGLNQAAAAARLGMRVALVARVGNDDRGDAAISRLYAEDVETRFIVRDAEARTGVVLVQVDQQGQKQTLSAPGAMERLTIANVEAAADAVRSARALLTSWRCYSNAPRQPRAWPMLPAYWWHSTHRRRASCPTTCSRWSM